MLIQALCDYYDILAKAGKVLPDGYSNVKIHYLVCLTKEGKIDKILNCQEKEEASAGKGKRKEKIVPRNVVMPKRTEKPGIEANIVEHRPTYLFGLNLVDGMLTAEDRTEKARKSHETLVEKNLAFLAGLDTPVVNAYREFLLHWNPKEETCNQSLLDLKKDYDKSNYIFCLSGNPDLLLHEDPQVREKWEKERRGTETDKKVHYAQCVVSGQEEPIARVHNKIKGVFGGLATGSVLISFKNPSESSYGLEQSYNSNISEGAMKKYTEALNYLLSRDKHRILLDDMTVIFWAMNANEDCEQIIYNMLFGTASDVSYTEKTDEMLNSLLKEAKNGTLTDKCFSEFSNISPEVEFYMVGLKPNSSRLAIKFIYRKSFADILYNVARYQDDMQVEKDIHPVPFYRVKGELVSPKSQKDKSANPALVAKLFEAVLYGNAYPIALLDTIVRRIRTDVDVKMNEVRAGIVKACINRNYAKKEEITMALNTENENPAYLCGRLFAVLEKLQQEALGNVNRTIKDAYFASASATPALIFPKLIRLAQNHLNKTKRPGFFNKLIGEIMEKLRDEFPSTFLLQDQGRFDIGYYQQNQILWQKSNETKNEDEKEDK